MNIITHSQRYIPHQLSTRIHAVKTYRQYGNVSHICRKYKISKSFLMRLNKRYDATKESLMNQSHRPHTAHPNAHTNEELKWIMDYHRRNPNISVCELY